MAKVTELQSEGSRTGGYSPHPGTDNVSQEEEIPRRYSRKMRFASKIFKDELDWGWGQKREHILARPCYWSKGIGGRQEQFREMGRAAGFA